MKNQKDFIKNVEKLVNPMEVGAIHFVHGINKMLPLHIQNKLSEIASKQYPRMGFVVEPYSSFLFYEIKDIQLAQNLLPDGFKLIKTKAFESDPEEKYYAIFGSIRAHTSAFWGARLEFYVIAEDEKTGLITWIIIDYDTDTIGQDKKYGLREPHSAGAVVTIDYKGIVIVDIANLTEKRQLSYLCDVNNAKMKHLDQRLWLEGNLSISYGKTLSNNSAVPFGLIFDPLEVEEALDISLEKVSIEKNSWFTEMLADKPDKVVVFPYAQHFIADTSGNYITIKNQSDLENAVNSFDFANIKPISATGFKYLIMVVICIQLLVILLLLLFK